MKILFCLGSMQKGGAERVVANLGNYLSKENNIYIVTSVNGKIEYKLNENIKLFTLDDKKVSKNKIIKNIHRRRNLKNVINEIEPDIVISFLPEPTFRLMSLRNNIKCPIIISERNDPNTEYKSMLYYIMMKKYYKKADGFVFQTEEAREYFNENIKKKSIIIPNPLNENFLEINENVKKENIIISVGSLAERKNQKLLINAFANISNMFPDYRLEIYGDGILRKELEEQIRKLNLEEKVLLPGKVDNIKEKLEKSKVFVLSSDYEGMPNALMEAMASGLSVISTDCPCGGPASLINNNENGILIPVNDEKALSEALEKILSDETYMKVLGKSAREIVENLNPQKIYKKWEEYIYQILMKKRGKNG